MAMSPPTTERTVASEPDELAARLVAEFGRSLYRLAVSIVRDHAMAEDVVQETLIRAWQAYPTYRGDAPLRAWVSRIGHNVAVSHLRRVREVPTSSVVLSEAAVKGVSDEVTNRLAVEEVWSVLDRVDPLSRELLILRDVDGRSYEEIADITGVSLPTVKTRLFRTRRLLADRLKEWR
jgi:RNA polymerase sigma-70 factor (ECF subfamily)